MSNIKKPVRVWSGDRKLRYGIVAESWAQLLLKIDEKFALDKKVSKNTTKAVIIIFYHYKFVN